ncbi:MAG: ATP phosphoribosyltransferase regulatory subunit [Clostridia bacterium]|nr:ATP phosphoribosyltransferase regulatory subunit [Clostridia bacterium]MBQ8850775.1 ATP phosphoribosyltransferase regulatory subunit [Clostridia bacterium]
MSFSDNVLMNNEKAIYSLRSLYKDYGYSVYKVSKFEEYDLYAHNKSFLVSKNILSFTDTNGKLLALKPDVTLSIIKNIPDGDTCTHKLCYNETVYRTSADSDGFREIMQTGLECIGEIDTYSECEVIMLAMKSLDTISKDHILDISHMGLVDGLLLEAGFDDAQRAELVKLIETKNVYAIRDMCEKFGIPTELKNDICAVTEMYMPIGDALSRIEQMIRGEKMRSAYDSLVSVNEAMKAYGITDKLYLDPTIVNDMNYYDGICFKGYINGIPDSVLSGGRYDKLLERLGRSSGAIGFAVYLDRLERFDNGVRGYDVDAVLLYEKGTDIKKITEAQKALLAEGKRVLVGHSPDMAQSYRQLLKLTDGGIEILENND